jgi:hypothetical protein
MLTRNGWACNPLGSPTGCERLGSVSDHRSVASGIHRDIEQASYGKHD